MAQAPAANSVRGFMQSLFNPQQQQQQQQQKDGKQAADPKQQGNNEGQDNKGATNDPNSMQNPMDVFKDLFAKADASAEKAPAFELPAETLNQAADSMDFTRGLPEELQQALVAAGDQGKLFVQLAQHMSRQAYASALAHGSKLTGQYMDVRSQFDQKGLGKTVKEHLALSNIDSMLENTQSPVVKEHLRMIGQQLAQKYPDANPAWISQQAKAFFLEMAKAVQPDAFGDKATMEAQEAAKAPGGVEFNWGDWLNGPKPS